MNHKKLTVMMLGLFVGILILGAGRASANVKTLIVDDNLACPGATFTSIQAAVNAANPGDTIRVCPGTYVEQVTIPAAKNSLTLRSEKPLAAIIKAPPTMAGQKAVVRVNGANGVSILGFTITGPGDGPCDTIRYGVLVDGNGSALIRGNHVTEIHDTPFSGCQNGIAIDVGLSANPGSAQVTRNIVDNYQKDGIAINGGGSVAEVTDNDVTGIGPTSVIAQNGILVRGGANALVRHNEVSDNIYTPQTFSSSGILLFQPGNVSVDHNKVSRNDLGIAADNTTSSVIITHNRATNNTFDGFDLLLGTTGADVSHNTSLNNGFDGIFVDASSTNNSITKNRMRGNAVFDTEDQSVGAGSCGTGNTWSHNNCVTDNKGGCLCSNDHDSGDDEEEDSAEQNSAAPRARAASTQTGQASRAPSP